MSSEQGTNNISEGEASTFFAVNISKATVNLKLLLEGVSGAIGLHPFPWSLIKVWQAAIFYQKFDTEKEDYL